MLACTHTHARAPPFAPPPLHAACTAQLVFRLCRGRGRHVKQRSLPLHPHLPPAPAPRAGAACSCGRPTARTHCPTRTERSSAAAPSLQGSVGGWGEGAWGGKWMWGVGDGGLACRGTEQSAGECAGGRGGGGGSQQAGRGGGGGAVRPAPAHARSLPPTPLPHTHTHPCARLPSRLSSVLPRINCTSEGAPLPAGSPHSRRAEAALPGCTHGEGLGVGGCGGGGRGA